MYYIFIICHNCDEVIESVKVDGEFVPKDEYDDGNIYGTCKYCEKEFNEFFCENKNIT